MMNTTSNVTIKGDFISLVDSGKFDVILNLRSCGCEIDSPIAEHLSKHYNFDDIPSERLNTKGNPHKLGTIDVKHHGNLSIVNLYISLTSLLPLNSTYSYYMFKAGLIQINEHFKNCTIGIPHLNAVNWNMYEDAIKKELTNCNVIIVKE